MNPCAGVTGVGPVGTKDFKVVLVRLVKSSDGTQVIWLVSPYGTFVGGFAALAAYRSTSGLPGLVGNDSSALAAPSAALASPLRSSSLSLEK